MRKYVFHLYNYILHVYAGRPGGYPEAFLNEKRKKKIEESDNGDLSNIIESDILFINVE